MQGGVGAQLPSTFHMEEDDPVPQEWAETQKNPAPKWQSTNHANLKIAPWTQSTTPARLPQAAPTKLTPCRVYTDSVEKFRRPTHPPFWILWRAFQNPIFSTSSVIP